MEYVHAFWVGGLICAAVQILMDRTKLMPGRIMVLLVCSGAVLGFLNIYGPFQKFAGAGASVPLLGFGNVLWNGVKEAVEKNGFLGIFMGGFKASAVGISAALIFGYLAYSSPATVVSITDVLFVTCASTVVISTFSPSTSC